MAGIALTQRDLAATRTRLRAWFEHRFAGEAVVSVRAANKAAGWSSESLIFTAEVGGNAAEYVIRIPPAGGGIFPHYDLGTDPDPGAVARARHPHSVAHSLRARPRMDRLQFLVMPRIIGHTPSDTSYATRGWLHDAGPMYSGACDSFLETLAALHRVPVGEASWLERPAGVGVVAELKWWREYAKWGTDNKVPDVMTEAFDWLNRQMPDQTGELSVCWNDARLSNAIFDDAGQIVGALDWEQACLCPAGGLRVVARDAQTDARGQRPRPRPGATGVRQPRAGDPPL